MTLLMRDQESWERGKAEGLAEGKAEGKAEGRTEGLAEGKAKGKFEILDYFLKNNPSVEVDAGASMLGFNAEELTEYKKARCLEPAHV